jgi:hypothetical protein
VRIRKVFYTRRAARRSPRPVASNPIPIAIASATSRPVCGSDPLEPFELELAGPSDAVVGEEAVVAVDGAVADGAGVVDEVAGVVDAGAGVVAGGGELVFGAVVVVDASGSVYCWSPAEGPDASAAV